MEITQTDKAYLVGILDGEGHISLAYNSDFGFYAAVKVYNNSQALHDWIQERFGGNFRREQKRDRCGCTYWTSTREIKSILETVHEFLVIKKAEAELLLLYLSGCNGKAQPHDFDKDTRFKIVAALQTEHARRREGA